MCGISIQDMTRYCSLVEYPHQRRNAAHDARIYLKIYLYNEMCGISMQDMTRDYTLVNTLIRGDMRHTTRAYIFEKIIYIMECAAYRCKI